MKRHLSPRLGNATRSQRSFEDFYRQHYPAVSRYVARRLSNSSHDDVVAATFTVAWQKFDRVREPALPWLYRVARFEVAHERRRVAREISTIETFDFRFEQLEHSEEHEHLESAMRQLSKDDVEILRLIHWEGLSRADVGLVLDCTVNTVNVRYHRAIERISGAVHRIANASFDPPVLCELPKETP